MMNSPREFSEQSGIPVEIPEKCRRCVTLARFALKHDELCTKIQQAEEIGLSGALSQHWVDQVAEVGEMTEAEAADFVRINEQRMRAEFMANLERLDGARDNQVSFAQYVLAHCDLGTVELSSVAEGVDMTAEVCGSTAPERVKGFDDVEIVRVTRSSSAVIPN